MKPRWLVLAGAWVALAAAVHLGAVWALPRLIMQRVLGQVGTEQAAGGVLQPPLVDHTQRRVVMPSPDLLYALCTIDLGQGPWRVRAQADRPGRDGYWSVALYAANTDNFHVVGDRDLGGTPLDLLVLPPDASVAPGATAAPRAGDAGTPGQRSVRAPSDRVLLLMRVLVGDPARDLAGAEAARRTLRCEPVR
jgi:uncharacterized membrane protein